MSEQASPPAKVVRVSIAAAGGHHRFLTSHAGYTHFNVLNEGDGEQAEVYLTWVEPSGKPRSTSMIIHGAGTSEHTFEAYAGAKVTVVNQSQTATVSVALCLG